MKPVNSAFRYFMCTICILFSMTSCHRSETGDETVYDRTVLVYMAADNNLSYSSNNFAQQDIDEMISVAGDIPSDSRLLIYIDDTELPRILSLEQQKGRRPIARVLHQYTSEHNSGDAETLRLALEWATDNCPARSYGLVLWSHGDAWLPAKSPAQRAVCLDSQSSTWMEIADIAHTLSVFPRMEFILFDACFMQSIEVAYELRNTAKYIIGSPAEIPAPGGPYKRLVGAMFAPSSSATHIAEEYYKEYSEGKVYIRGREPATYGVCLSVVDCDELEQLAATTQAMITKYASTQSELQLTGVQRYFLPNSSYRPAYYDMNGYMLRLLTDADDYNRWASALGKAVPYRITTPHWYSDYTGTEYITLESYSGISCYVPRTTSNRRQLNEAFRSTSWYHAAGWDQIGW